MTSETRSPLLTWLTAAAIALAMSSSYLLDGPDEIESARLDAQALADARTSAAAIARHERAIERFCAQQGAIAHHTADGSFTCTR